MALSFTICRSIEKRRTKTLFSDIISIFFYVGISRAKQYLFVAESDYPEMFNSLFNECFERKNKDGALAYLKDIAGRIEIDDDEFIQRIEKFCSLEQYDNARNTADRLSSDELRKKKTCIYLRAREIFAVREITGRRR